MHLEQLAGLGDPEAAAELAAIPTLPPEGAHIFRWWLELAATRTSSGFGPNPITRREIHDWENDTGNLPEPWERRVIFDIDAVWRRGLNDKADDPKQAEQEEEEG